MILDVPHGTHPTNDKVAILLAELQAATATTTERRDGFWISMHSRQWREILGSRYKAAIHEAVNAGYIEVNDRYSVGRFCKSYRLAKRYRQTKTEPYALCCTRSTISRIRIDETDDVGQLLVEQFARVRLTGSVNGWDGYCAAQIRRGLFYATRCQYGRFHSTFTGLKRAVRSRLSVDGERLFELDIANCQPLILGLIATHNNNRHNPQTQPTTTTTNRQTNPYSICGAFLTDQNLKNYIELCERGELYECLERRCRGWLTLRDCIPSDRWHRYATDRPLTRKDVKRQFLVMLFADVATTTRMPLFDVVGTEWPALADYILDAKSDCYQNLARDCQRLESRLMIDGAAGSLLTDPSIPIVTIHDAILTTAEHLPAVEAAVVAEFGRLGVTPKIKPPDTGHKGQYHV